MAARYVLCTMIDEAAADTPWGGSGVWGRHSLLVMFHNETEGGEKVFQLMARLAEKPAENRDLLELIYVALALGFEGRYRVIDNGRAQLDAVRDRLAQILKQQRGDYSHALAEHWQGQPVERAAHAELAAACGRRRGLAALLLVGAYLGAVARRSQSRSDPVFGDDPGAAPDAARASRRRSPRRSRASPSSCSPTSRPAWSRVSDEIDRSVVTIRGDGIFATGSATLLPEREALMGRIADALAQVAGQRARHRPHRQPADPRSARFPSNWHLSRRARARTCATCSSRTRSRPSASAPKAAPTPSRSCRTTPPTNRALNRRVEVTLFVGRALRGEREPAARQMIAKLLGLVFNRWVLLAVAAARRRARRLDRRAARSPIARGAVPLEPRDRRAGSRSARSSR